MWCHTNEAPIEGMSQRRLTRACAVCVCGPREIQPRGALSCSDCQGRQAWFCRSTDLQGAGLLAQVLGQQELAIATIRSSVEVLGSVCDVPGVLCEDRWICGLWDVDINMPGGNEVSGLSKVY